MDHSCSCSCLCGLYRARVVAVDGLRLNVSIPDLSGTAGFGWALPCTSPATTTDPNAENVVWLVPAVGSAVWVMFERGDALHPVWMGVLSA